MSNERIIKEIMKDKTVVKKVDQQGIIASQSEVKQNIDNIYLIFKC